MSILPFLAGDLLVVDRRCCSAGRFHMTVGTTAVGLEIYLMLVVDRLLEFARIGLVRFLFLETAAAVAGRAGGRRLILMGNRIAPVGVQHRHPHGIVKRCIAVPEPGLRAADALVFDFYAPGFLVVRLLVAVVVGPGTFAVVAFHAAVGNRTV